MVLDKQKVLITGKLHPVFFSIFDERHADFEYRYEPDLDRESLLEIVAPFHCIVSRSETDVNAELIDRAPCLRVIARAAVGVGNIDVDYATGKGILVFNTPYLNTNSAAELTLGLMLACARKIVSAHCNMLDNGWNRHRFTGFELKGKTVGIVGLGNVGSRLADLLSAFGCRLFAYDPFVGDDHFRRLNCSRVDLPVLLAEADVITVHTPKNGDTVNLIGEKSFALMKDGVVVINAARGGIVNEASLAKALAQGKVAAAGIDTWDAEPVANHPLKAFPQVVMTPHIGASTVEAQRDVAEAVAEETLKALSNQWVANPVNLPKMRVLEGSLARRYASLAEKLGMLICQYKPENLDVERAEFLYRGEIKTQDWELIKIAFLKGFFKAQTDETVTFVNALRIAETRGLRLTESSDKNFTDYASAIRIRLGGTEGDCTVGGTVLGTNSQRLSYLNGMKFEIEPQGHILAMDNRDEPGVIGHVGTVLANHGINVNQFELSRLARGGKAMAMILVDDFISDEILDDLLSCESILRVKRIRL